MGRILGQIREIQANVERFTGESVSQQVMAGIDQIKETTKPEKVARWVKNVIERLDTLVAPQTGQEIMMNCGYNCALMNQTPIRRAVERRKRYDTVAAFLEAEQKNPPAGTRLAWENDVVYQYYQPHAFTRPMRCYCSLFRGLPESETSSLTYCQCSRGFVQKYWESILEKPVVVDLLESAISGADECKFVIHL